MIENDTLQSAGSGRLAVTGRVIWVGDDPLFILSGGEMPHIGACALGLPAATNRLTSASVLTAPGHRDDLLAREFSISGTKKLGCTVCVVVGIHIENPQFDELQQLQEHARTVFQKMLEAY